MKTQPLTLPILHTIIIIITWLSFLWLDWKIIFGFYVLYTLQMIIFKGCILTNWQFNKSLRKENEMTMYTFWLEKAGYKVNRKKLRFLSRWIMPVIIIILSLIWQVLLNHVPLISI